LKLKDSELKFVVAGSHSLHSLENDGLIQLVQTVIEIGASFGLVDVRDVFYGRKTIREEAMVKFEDYIQFIRTILDEPVKQHCLAATCDIWTDD
ncbi:unnamed protein product, partial [Didymodactylos carnosus]